MRIHQLLKEAISLALTLPNDPDPPIEGQETDPNDAFYGGPRDFHLREIVKAAIENDLQSGRYLATELPMQQGSRFEVALALYGASGEMADHDSAKSALSNTFDEEHRRNMACSLELTRLCHAGDFPGALEVANKVSIPSLRTQYAQDILQKRMKKMDFTPLFGAQTQEFQQLLSNLPHDRVITLRLQLRNALKELKESGKPLFFAAKRLAEVGEVDEAKATLADTPLSDSDQEQWHLACLIGYAKTSRLGEAQALLPQIHQPQSRIPALLAVYKATAKLH